MGVVLSWDEYALGYIFFGVIMLAIMGPLYFFSEFSTFSIKNPVLSSEVSISIIINKTLSVSDLENRMVGPMSNQNEIPNVYDEQTNMFIGKRVKDLYEKKDLHTSVPFKIFDVKHPNMRNIDDKIYNSLEARNWTETQFFKSEQVQEVICTEYPDDKWTIDRLNGKFFREDLINTIRK